MHRWIKWLPIEEYQMLNLNLKMDISWIPEIIENTILTILKIFIFNRTICFVAHSCYNHILNQIFICNMVYHLWYMYCSLTLQRRFTHLIYVGSALGLQRSHINAYTSLFLDVAETYTSFKSCFRAQCMYMDNEWYSAPLTWRNIYPLISAPHILMYSSIIFLQ